MMTRVSNVWQTLNGNDCYLDIDLRVLLFFRTSAGMDLDGKRAIDNASVTQIFLSLKIERLVWRTLPVTVGFIDVGKLWTPFNCVVDGQLN